jgi:hypothetical protein
MQITLPTLVTVASGLANMASALITPLTHREYSGPPQVCWMPASIQQTCEDKKVISKFHISEIRDTAHQTILEKDELPYMRMYDDRPLIINSTLTHIPGGKNLSVNWYPDLGQGRRQGKILFTYDECEWWSDRREECGACEQDSYWNMPLDCETAFPGQDRVRTSSFLREAIE